MAQKPYHYDKYGQLCVLSVDDDQVNLMVIEQLLAPEGWKIVSAMDGVEAMEALQGDTWPDFVFLDYTMNTGDSGDEICRKMRGVFGSTPVPIVMCTALTAGHSALAECLAAGATDYLLKPYERVKMIEKVEKYCGAKCKQAAPTTADVRSSATASAAAADESVLDFCMKLDLEYCGKKLQDLGVTVKDLRGMDDAALRKAGIVVKSQRDKILAAV
mmetsp:Transcript_18081/g.38907  ORF Transcript_18081/g.38907 Transcript_18081/m.38907 type:complete len:216 (+) Transcript_18081:138-785(+)|eukprot:CAMPEP_0202894080 /NCGR_PEP_ID=MMETSP1392-20130828/3530_1 /ASSEMBLY_ACC=CAM_ASM_000868 /TAXON_ID=225041 /ORGANISM="Chlamydomonas chlamydogama, Strain SAG 11-48b" /LENGTH=215 /DNA_ID=CAMNT_0049578635 /DNA_START=138 /DNA_END=785 /DNA_ORIENTATION=-